MQFFTILISINKKTMHYLFLIDNKLQITTMQTYKFNQFLLSFRITSAHKKSAKTEGQNATNTSESLQGSGSFDKLNTSIL